jgi:hypothetical protein
LNNPWPALSVGVALVGLGVSAMISHVRSWRRMRDNAELGDEERTYYYRRYRRRLQISGMLAILGILIGVGDVILPWQQRPLWPTLYWIGVLLLTGWVLLLGIADLVSTAAYSRAQLARVRQQQRELERHIVEFKHRHLGESRDVDADRDSDDAS